jgi:hypothetical protein
MRKSALFSMIVAIFACGQASADNFSYNKIDLGLIGTNIDYGNGIEIDGVGLGANGSWEFGSNVFGFGGVSHVELSVDGEELGSITQSSLGLGFNVPLGSRIDLVGTAAYQRADLLDADGYDAGAADGYGIGLGVRGLGGKRFHWHANLNYSDLDGEGGLAYEAGFRFQFTRLFGLGLDLSASDDDGVTTGIATLAFRFQFGDRD